MDASSRKWGKHPEHLPAVARTAIAGPCGPKNRIAPGAPRPGYRSRSGRGGQHPGRSGRHPDGANSTLPPHFTRAEYGRRLYAAREAVAAAGLDGLLLFEQESMYWLTGYDTFGFCFFQCLVCRRRRAAWRC